MSDDLISREALLETERLLMTDVVKNNQAAKCILEQVLFDIEHAETVFGKEKVIESIKVVTAGYVLNYNYPSEYVQVCVDMSKEIIKIIEKGM